jgi:hypothetical protein
MSLLNSIVPNCQQAARFQSEAMDRKLSFVKRASLGLHLLLCRWCRRYGQQIHHLHSAVHNHQEQLISDGPPRLSSEARERIKAKLKNNS